MKKFNRGGSSDRGDRGGRDFGSRGGDRRFGGDRPAMHHAVCSNCGKDCEVPFKPTGDKPVFCSDCFKKQGGGQRNFDRRDSRDSRPRFEKKMYLATCDRCGKKCEVPFRPTGDKPVYCSDCFEIINKPGTRAVDNSLDKHFASLNSKLDSIIKLLSPGSVAKPQATAKAPAKKSAASAKPAAKKKAPAKKKK